MLKFQCLEICLWLRNFLRCTLLFHTFLRAKKNNYHLWTYLSLAFTCKPPPATFFLLRACSLSDDPLGPMMPCSRKFFRWSFGIIPVCLETKKPNPPPSGHEFGKIGKGLIIQKPLGLTLQGINISPKNGILKMIFLFPRWDMLVPWRVVFQIIT